MTGLVSHNIGNFFFSFSIDYLPEHICVITNIIGYLLFFVSRIVSLNLCSQKECFISGFLDRTVLLWDQRAEKCQVQAFEGLLWHTMNKDKSVQERVSIEFV